MTNVFQTLADQTLVALDNAKQATKRAAKTATKKASKPVAKQATKPVSKAAVKPVSKATENPFKFYLITGRPTAGNSLYAFTAAWFAMAGIDKGKAIDKATAVKVAGASAISYHVKTGRMVESDGMIKLSEGGKLHFAARKIDDKLHAVWVKVLSTGKPDGTIIKNAKVIAPIA